jgi:plastocyanin
VKTVYRVASLGFVLLLAGCGQRVVSHNPNTITMVGGTFSPVKITIPAGETITFLDDSDNGATHFLVIGANGEAQHEAGAQDFGGLAGYRMEAGDLWQTKPWMTPGTYHVTCTVHPGMNLTITVKPAPSTLVPAVTPSATASPMP